MVPRDADRVEAIVGALDTMALPVPDEHTSLPRPYHRQDVPDHEEWTRMVRWALDAIDGGGLDKVVLARRVALALGATMDPLLVLSHLEPATPGCYHFAVRPANGSAFVGASPERLFRRSDSQVVSEAVAGTRPRGETEAEDAALREALLNSPKERREHAFVRDAIRDDLEAVCTSVHVPDEVGELALARGRHLHARLTGTLRPGTTTTDVLKELHPTPAVGGVPTEDAVAAIRAQEPFDRGWYAGPVGWVGRTDAEFAVGLRAGLVEEDQVALFSGAGIVDGSAPDREWEEIEQKIGDFAAILGVTDSQPASR
jgi:menaquinone-specific isochorismate synthase